MSSRNFGGCYRCICPACGGRMRIKDSDAKSPTVKTMYGQCTNFGCSASYVGTFSWDFELATPGVESARVRLPPSPTVERTRALMDRRSRGVNQMDMLVSQ